MIRNLWRSSGAVAAGFVFIALLGFLTDTALQSVGVLLALSYHLLYAVLGAYVTARLAPGRPLTHALVLGVAGTIFSTLGLIVIITGDLAPAWYGLALVVLSLPVCWLGGMIYVRRQARAAR